LKDGLRRSISSDETGKVGCPAITPGGKYWLRKQKRELLDQEWASLQQVWLSTAAGTKLSSNRQHEMCGQAMHPASLIPAIVALKSVF